MKRLFTAILSALFVLTMNAQNEDFPLQFTNAGGNIIADATELHFTHYEDDGFNLLIPTHLFVKNISEQDVQGGAVYHIISLDNGIFQTCFPQNCVMNDKVGTFETTSGLIPAGTSLNMQTEWLPESTGTMQVEYQLVLFKENVVTNKWVINKYGPKVTMTFSYDPASIKTTEEDALIQKNVEFFLPDGKSTETPQRGVNLKRITYQDGSHRVVKTLGK
mgnify:CR=1 FL=1